MKRNFRFTRQTVLSVIAAGLLFGTPLPSFGHSDEATRLIVQGDECKHNGQYTQAIDFYQRALKVEPKSAELHNKLGLCYSSQQQEFDAIGEYRKALECNPKCGVAAHNLASAMYKQGDYNQAIDNYRKAIELGDNNEVDLICLGSVYRDRATLVGGSNRDADLKNSLELFQQALQVNPNSAVAHNNLGLLYMRIRRFDEAADEISKAIKLKDDYSQAYFNLGLVEQARNHMPEALTAFQNSLRYESNETYKEGTRAKIRMLGIPQNTDHFTRGYDYLSQKKWSEAEAELRQCIDSDSPDTAVTWNNLGLALAQQGRTRDAISAYRKAVALKPSQFPQAEYNLGQALFHAGDLVGAERALRLAIAQSSGTHALAHNALGMVLKKKGDERGAQAEYRLAILQSGDMLPVVHFNLGMLLAEQPDRAQNAIDEFKRYLTQAPAGQNVAVANAKMQSLSANR